MDASLGRLMKLLNEETAAYREMAAVLDEEHNLPALSHRERFESVESRKEQLIARIKMFEKERCRLVRQLGRGLGWERASITVSQLAALLPVENRNHLLARADTLRSVVGVIQSKNRRNRKLIHQYLGLIDGAMKLFARAADGSTVYSKSGSEWSSAGYRRGGGRIFCGNA